MTAINTAMILGAGLGTRMRPLTDHRPKPLVHFAGRPLIDHALDRLAKAGVCRAVVNVHYLADRLEAHLGTRTHPQIIISDERDALLDTGGGVVRALPLLGSGPFFIHNSETAWVEVMGSALERLIVAWDPERMDCLMLLALAATSIGYEGNGDFDMDASGRLARRSEGRQAPFVFTGVSIAHPRMFEGAPHGPFSLNRPWDRAIREGRLYGIPLDGTWMHIGTPEALNEAEAFLRRSHEC